MSKLKLNRNLKKIGSSEAGAVAMEYGMITSLVAVALITTLSGIGSNLGTSFQVAANAIGGGRPSAPPPAPGQPMAAPTMMAPLQSNP